MVRGVFQNSSNVGVAVVVVTRTVSPPHSCFLKFVEAENAFWSWHLFDNEDTPSPAYVHILSKTEEAAPATSGRLTEWVTAWYVLGEKDMDYGLGGAKWLKNPR